jgi:hypothetical protein
MPLDMDIFLQDLFDKPDQTFVEHTLEHVDSFLREAS